MSSSIPTWQLEDKASTKSKVDTDETSANNDVDLHKAASNGEPEKVSTTNGVASSSPDLVLQD